MTNVSIFFLQECSLWCLFSCMMTHFTSSTCTCRVLVTIYNGSYNSEHTQVTKTILQFFYSLNYTYTYTDPNRTKVKWKCPSTHAPHTPCLSQLISVSTTAVVSWCHTIGPWCTMQVDGAQHTCTAPSWFRVMTIHISEIDFPLVPLKYHVHI